MELEYEKTLSVERDVTAHASVNIYKDYYDETRGTVSLDDGIWWKWNGRQDEFLLGLMRIENSPIYPKFNEEVEKRGITKEDVSEAIINSLEENPNDGLYSLLGDEKVYTELGSHILTDERRFMEKCLKYEGATEKRAKEVADDIIGKIRLEKREIEDIIRDTENKLSKNFVTGKSWKETVEDTINACKVEPNVKEFLNCMSNLFNYRFDAYLILEKEVERKIIDKMRKFKNSKRELSKLSSTYDIPKETILACIRH